MNAPQLPDGWSAADVVSDEIVADGLKLHRAGVASKGPDGTEMTGAAADPLASPIDRSYFELLERVAIHDSSNAARTSWQVRDRAENLVAERPTNEVFPASDDPSRWRFARSNGVAIHRDWPTACDRAYWELVERDRILRSWYGEIAPAAMPWAVETTPLARLSSYDVRIVAFPAMADACWGHEIDVVGVLGFPTRRDAPLFFGFGARPEVKEALEAAVSEALQSLAFLWGEDIPSSLPASASNPLAHLERVLWPEHHASLRKWLEGAHASYRSTPPDRTLGASGTEFLDLTPAWLGGGMRVAKAVSPAAAPLAFGQTPFTAHLPPHLRLHPIA